MSLYGRDPSTGDEFFVSGDSAYPMIAEEEFSPTTKPHDAGDHFIYGGLLCVAKTNIARNTVLVFDTNYEYSDTIEEQISSLKEALANEVEARSQLGAHNILKFTCSTAVQSAVTFTVNSDSSISANGTASDNIAYIIGTVEGEEFLDKKLILNGCPSGGNENWHLVCQRRTSSGYVDEVGDYGEGAETIPLISGQFYRVVIYIKSGTVINSKTFYPMLRLASDADPTYQPYAMTNQQLTSEWKDRTIAVELLSTNATTLTDFSVNLTDKTLLIGVLDYGPGNIIATSIIPVSVCINVYGVLREYDGSVKSEAYFRYIGSGVMKAYILSTTRDITKLKLKVYAI